MRTDNSETQIASFGFINIEIYNGTEKLQIATGKQATLTAPIPSSVQGKAPATMPLWYYDEQKGEWIEEGSANRTGNNYSGKVSHFTSWNFDIPAQTSYLTGKVVDSAGNAISCARIFASGTNCYGNSCVSTSDDGTFKVPVMANSSVAVYAKYYTFSCTTQNISTPDAGQTTDIGNLRINVNAMNTVTVVGRILDNAGYPLEGVYLKLYTNDSANTRIDLGNTSHDGKFKLFGNTNLSYYILVESYFLDSSKGKKKFYLTTDSTFGTKDMGDLTIDVGGTAIIGRVVDTASNHLGSIEVYTSEYMYYGQKNMLTDSTGVFSIRCRPNVTVHFRLAAFGRIKYFDRTTGNLGDTLRTGYIVFP